jgi:hypothetical protein
VANQLSVGIYIRREDIESILSDPSVKQVVVEGSIDIIDTKTCEWNIYAVGYSPSVGILGSSVPTCPQPCP